MCSGSAIELEDGQTRLSRDGEQAESDITMVSVMAG